MSKKGENIYKRKDGRWEGRYKCGYNKNGKTVYKSVYASAYKECKEKLNIAKVNFSQDTSKNKLNMTVKELLDEWIDVISLKVKKSTINSYNNIINNHIFPVMAKLQVMSLTTNYLNKFVIDKSKNGRIDNKGGLSPKTIKNILGILKSAFKYAEKVYHINNPISYVTLPREEVKKIEILTDDEIFKIRAFCQKKQDYFLVAYDLCLLTGIRIGELCALQCKDIDFENKIIKIEKTVQRIKNNNSSEKKTIVIIDSPKTKTSVREIPLPDKLINELKELIKNKTENEFVFTSSQKNADHKKPLDVRTIQKRFAVILRKCKIKNVKFHILRHTFATKWANSSYDIKGLSEILGHSNVNITMALYVHSSMDNKRKEINALF